MLETENVKCYQNVNARLGLQKNASSSGDRFVLHAGMGLTTICVKYCCSSSWNTELGGRPRRLAADPLAPLRAGLLPLLPLLRLRPGLVGVVGAGLAGGMETGRSCGGAGGVEPETTTAAAAGGGMISCGVAAATGSAGATAGKSGSG